MKVILLEDVRSLGKKDEIVEINDGYARNFIIPKKLGLEANNKNLNELKQKKANEAKIAKEKYDNAVKLAADITDKSVVIQIKAGKDGKTFGSISSKEIATVAKEQLQLDIDKKKIVLTEPIKSLGSYIVDIKIHKDVAAKLLVKVIEG